VARGAFECNACPERGDCQGQSDKSRFRDREDPHYWWDSNLHTNTRLLQTKQLTQGKKRLRGV
jgi:hypothetical protein